jgi:5-methylcytosine-specific restriction enzyme A
MGRGVRLFFHHVGQKGADEDFKKTVYKDVSIQTVESNVPGSYPHRDELLNQLRQAFPDGLFDCWGVPAGAKSVIRQLQAGDIVLLVHSATEYGEVPVLCHVQVFWPNELRDLSFALWGNDKYPYIFVFRTVELTLTWPELREHLEAVMNSISNGLGMQKTEACGRPSQPDNPHPNAVFTQVHNTL